MTVTHQVIIGIDDLRAIRFACARCASAIAMPFDQPIRVPQACPNCGENWTGLWNTANQLIEAIKPFLGSRDARVLVQLELPPDTRS